MIKVIIYFLGLFVLAGIILPSFLSFIDLEEEKWLLCVLAFLCGWYYSDFVEWLTGYSLF